MIASSFLTTALLATFPIWIHKEALRLYLADLLILELILNATVAFATVFWQQLAATTTLSSIQIMTAGAVTGNLGILSMGSAWAVVILDLIVMFMGLLASHARLLGREAGE